MRGLVLFILAALPVAPAQAKLLPSYGYGRTAADAAPVLDLRGLLPPGPDAKLPVAPTMVASASPAAGPASSSLSATCYDVGREGVRTASGEVYRSAVLSASHPDMPLSSLAMVTDLGTGKEVIVRVNDRPASGAGVDLSPSAAQALGLAEGCRAEVAVRRLGVAPYAPASQPLPAAYVASVSQQAPVLTPEAGPPAPTQGGFQVQVGAYSQRANAEAARVQASSAGPASIEPALVGGVSLFRVRLGPWPSREEAEQARVAAEALGFAGAKLTTP